MSRHRIVWVAAALTASVAAAVVAATVFFQAESTGRALPTEVEGRAALAEQLERAQGRGEDFCRRTRSRADCESAWALAGGVAAVPRTPPLVMGVRVQGVHRVLILCGTNGRGEPYHSDFAVTMEGGTLVPVEPVFWFDVRVPESGAEQVAQALPPGAAPEPCAS